MRTNPPLIALALLAALTAPACTLAYTNSPSMAGDVHLSGLGPDREVAGSADVSSFRVGMSAAIYGRLSVYGELLEVSGWEPDDVAVDDVETAMFGAELSVPVLLPLVVAGEADMSEDALLRALEVSGGLAGGGDASSRHVAVGAAADLLLFTLHLRAEYRWLDVDVSGDLVHGSAELEGWGFQIGVSVPGDLRFVIPFLHDIPM